MKALVTVTNALYIEGTEVLFQSFLQNNPGFEGDLLVIHDGLSKLLQERLLQLFPITFVNVSSELKGSVKKLVAQQPHYANRYARFWSLEAFNLQKYETVLFMDSDTLCRKNLDELFKSTAPFAAAPDRGFHEGVGRHFYTFEKITEPSKNEGHSLQTFNAGVLFFKPKQLPGKTFTSLLELISPEVFAQVTSGHTDQYVLNRHFHQQVFWLSSSYNFLMKRKGMDEHEKLVQPEEAHIWHYIRHPKPWKLKKLVKFRLSRPTEIASWKEWHQHYRNVLLARMKKGKGLAHLPHWILSYVFAR